MLAQQDAQLLGRDRVGVSLVVLEVQASFRPLEHVGAAGRGMGRAVGAVAVEVDDVIVVRALAEVLPKVLERRRAEDRHLRGEVLLVDQLDQRPRDRTVEDIFFKRPGGDEQDVDLDLGPPSADLVGLAHSVEPPLDLARLG